MSGVHRLLTRRDKRSKDKTEPIHGGLGPVFVPEEVSKKKDKEEDKKVKEIQSRLQRYGITNITEANIEYALRAPFAAGSIEEGFKTCLLLEDTYEGLLKQFDPNTKLLGAVNREGVTCYLDALLFAMFARLDSFEAMVYDSLEDPARKKLAGLLRLWVNMLRTGRLITVDVTKQVQEAMSECGWEAANQLQQQDTSEAFTFITGQLELPLLTLKMDMFHTGKDDPNDDHKFVNERLLEVAILSEPPEGGSVVTLEDCLEHYFNNRVEVKRHMEQQRRSSLKRMDSIDKTLIQEKSAALHIESVDLGDAPPESPAVDSPASMAEIMPEPPRKGPIEQLRPVAGMRKRADSIFSQKRVKVSVDGEPAKDGHMHSDPAEQQRKASLRTEVLMPAWQFFKLLPWYTDNMPTSDAQVAAHFARKRPILGICLKRYTVSNTGAAARLDTYIDIPLEIAVPDFVSGDDMEEGGPLVGNFKLVLQSVVCHRGKSVHSGHYVSLVRGYAPNAGSDHDRPGSSSSDGMDDPWMLFDDLARERVSYVNINKALKDECPYLLFYQVQPIDVDDATMAGPPSYHEATSRANSDAVGEIPEKIALPEYSHSEPALVESHSPTSLTNHERNASFDAVDWAQSVQPSARNSMDAGNVLDSDTQPRFSTSSNRRSSVVIDDVPTDRESMRTASVTGGASTATTPLDDNKTSFLGLPSRRTSRLSSGPRKTKPRPSSEGPEQSNRFSLNMSKLTARMSRTDNDAAASTNQADKDQQQLTSGPSGSEGSYEALPEQIVHEKSAPAALTTGVLSKKDLQREKKAKIKEQSSGSSHGHGHSHLRRKKGEVPDRDCLVM